MKTNITEHTNANGIHYFSKVSDDGLTIYSFTDDFEDIWSQEDENFHALRFPYYTGDIALDCPPTEGHWAQGIFTAKDGSRWAVQDEDCPDEGNGVIYLTPA